MNVEHRDIFDNPRGVLVHGVNMQGRFNAGFAKQVRRRYPQAYEDYMTMYAEGRLMLGTIIPTVIHNQLIIVSGVTQQFYGREPGVRYVDYYAIQRVFENASDLAQAMGLPLIFPRIGASLGGGDWLDIKEIIDRACHPHVERTVFIAGAPWT